MKPTIKPINISFRAFEIQDIEDVLVIERLAYKIPWNKAKFTHSLHNPNTVACLIFKDNQVLGYSIALRASKVADLLNICIHPDYQHQGLGKKLFVYQLQASGVKEVFIEVRTSNHSALSFYKKLRFEAINTRKKYYSDGEDAIILRFITDNQSMTYKHIHKPVDGKKITFKEGVIQVPNKPIIGYIEGDGIGADVSPVMKKVIDAVVDKTYDGQRAIQWMEIYAGEKANALYGEYLPQETLDAIQALSVAIKGPLTTPVGGGMRSLNVAIRQELDLFICQRPVQYFVGTPTPVKAPEKVDMVIFRENSEDIYAGIEYQAGTEEVKKVINFLQNEMRTTKIRFPQTSGIGIKPVSQEGTQRLVRAAIQYAIDNDKDSVTLVHKGNIMKFTEGGFRDWGYQLAQDEFGAKVIGDGPWCEFSNPNTGSTITVKDVIADAFLQQILLRPEEYSVIATLNLNGDYISDALAAQVGGIGIAPGANLSDTTAVFEATHGTAPKYAGQNKVNPGSIILSAEMMLRHMGWTEAADNVLSAMSNVIQNKTVTYDLERLMDGATLLSCSEFGDALIDSL